jgi:hypothetical protein
MHQTCIHTAEDGCSAIHGTHTCNPTMLMTFCTVLILPPPLQSRTWMTTMIAAIIIITTDDNNDNNNNKNSNNNNVNTHTWDGVRMKNNAMGENSMYWYHFTLE